MNRIFAAASVAATAIIWQTPSEAAIATPYECRGEIATYFVGYEDGNDDMVFVNAEFAPPRDQEQLEFTLPAVPSGSGFRFSSDMGSFYGKADEAWFEVDGGTLECNPVSASMPAEEPGPAGGDLEVQGSGQSLGGNVRSGPGTDFGVVGNLPEGAPLMIERYAGVLFDGYEWFEISSGDLRGFQWGGILCSEQRQIDGVFQQCGVEPGDQSVGGPGWWMAFAVDGRGTHGHGHAGSEVQAENFALQYCGNPDCDVVDTTQDQCHALSHATDGDAYFYGIGSASANVEAETEAMTQCSSAFAGNSCDLAYSFCQ